MPDRFALLKVAGRLLLLPLLALGSEQLEAACARFTDLPDASAMTFAGAGRSTARQLPLDLEFNAGGDRLTRSSRRELQQLLACAGDLGFEPADLLVVGYASPSETGQATPMALAHDRADAVARQLRHAGLDATAIRAAQSSAADGSAPLARVELWLRD